MGRIEDNGRVNNTYKPVYKPKVEPLKQQPLQNNQVPNFAATKKNETLFVGNQQKTKLNEIFNQNQQNNSLLIGGTAGSTAAQFTLSEQNTRNQNTIKIKGGAGTPADFVNKVEADFQKLAPNTTVERRPTNSPYYEQLWDKMYGKDTLAVVRTPENNLKPRVSGNDQGYRLLDQLTGNKNEVTINYVKNNAYAQALSNDSFGSVTNPGKGSGVNVFYDPDLNVKLPAKNTSGSLVNTSVDSAIILGHELSHASHMQRGTRQNFIQWDNSITSNAQIKGSQGKENVFSLDGKTYLEKNNLNINLREEYRNVGFDGHRYGLEPTENSLRQQLGITEKRVSYQYQNSFQQIGSTEAFVQRNLTRAQTFSDSVIDGVKGSRNSALIGAGFNTAIALAEGKDTKGVVTDAAIGAGTGVTQEVIERVVNGPRATTSGMTSNSFQAARATLKGAAVAGAVINTGFAIYDQFDNLKNDATRSQAVGTIAGEAVVGAASGAAGAYAGAMAGAAIGSIVPGVGTVIGGVVGFAVGAAAGYLADKGLRGLGVNNLVAQGVTAAYDGVSKAASTVAEGAKDLFNGAVSKLSSIFG